MVPILAFSLQDQVETYGVYVGLAAFLGLAVLSLLYFAQARELKRLREWAGRAPERAQEIEARAIAQAEEALKQPEPRTVGPAQPVEQPTTVAPAGSDNGRQAGTPAPIPMGPRPATAAAAVAQAGAAAAAWSGPQAPPAPGEAPPADDDAPEGAESPQPATGDEPAAAPPAAASPPGAPPVTGDDSSPGAPPTTGDDSSPGAPPATGDEPPPAAAPGEPSPAADDEPAPATAGASPPDAPAPPSPTPPPARAGNGVPADRIPPAQIPRATPRPAPRGIPAQPARAPSRSATVPPRRGATASRRPADHSGAGRMALLAVIGVLVLAGGAFTATRIFGGEDPAPPPNRPTDSTGGPATGTGGGSDRAAAARPETIVAVLNGTLTEGLASNTRDKLIAEGYSEGQGMIRTGNNTDQQRQDSVVLYRAGHRRQARDVASILDIDAPLEEFDLDTQALADSTDQTNSGRRSEVAVIIGADQTQ